MFKLLSRGRGRRQMRDSRLQKKHSIVTKIADTFVLVKGVSLALGSLLVVVLFCFIVTTSIFNTDTLVEPISVPPTFVESGYTPEITTTRLLDEIAKINTISTTPMPKKGRIGGKQPGDDLVKLQSLPLAGKIDFNSLQTIIQESFGVKKERLTGEITFFQVDGKTVYHVRIRSRLANKLLVDFKVESDISDVIRQTAVKIVEELEPVVAASYHAWTNDPRSRLRLIDEALRNEDPSDDNFALMDRVYFYQARNKYVLAQEDVESILMVDPQFAPALCAQSLLHRVLDRDREQSLLFAQKCIERWPNDWHSTLNLAYAYRFAENQAMAEAEFLKAVQLGITVARELDRVGQYFVLQNKGDQALKIYSIGLKRFPDNPVILRHYGEILISKKRFDQANQSLSKAYELDPKNPEIWLALQNDAVNQDTLFRNELKKKLTDYVTANPDSPVAVKFMKLSEAK